SARAETKGRMTGSFGCRMRRTVQTPCPGMAFATPPADMELGNQRASGNVEDRRGIGMVGSGLGVGGIVVAVIAYFLGFDPGTALQVGQQVSNSTRQESREAPRGTPTDQMGQFVSRVLGSTEDVWSRVFQQS